MRVIDIMSSPAETIETSEPARAARDRMEAAGFHHLVAVEKGNPAGMISLRELTFRGAELGEQTVADVMNPDLALATPHETVRDAANRLRGRRAGALGVVDGAGKIAGVVTMTDLLELIGRGVQRPVEKPERRGKLETARTRRPSPPRK